MGRMKDELYRPLSRRRRLLIALLAVATAVTIVWTLLRPPAGSRAGAAAARMPDVPLCGPGQTTDCVGGREEVFMVGPSPTAVAPAPARSASP
jgi:hypothetical protein